MLETMIQRAKDLTARECLGMVRCISTALSLVNAAEVQHRLRSIKRHERESGNVFPGPLYHTEDSVKGSIHALLQQGQATTDEIWKQLSTQKVERKYHFNSSDELSFSAWTHILFAIIIVALKIYSRSDGASYRGES